jgi:hypothetical protein
MADKQLITEQEQLFNDTRALQGRVQTLASYIQNPFDTMLEDGRIDKKRLKVIQQDVLQAWDTFIDDCRSIRVRTAREVQKHVENR